LNRKNLKFKIHVEIQSYVFRSRGVQLCARINQQVLVEHKDLVSCVVVADGNRSVVSGSHDTRLLVWNLHTDLLKIVMPAVSTWVSGVYESSACLEPRKGRRRIPADRTHRPRHRRQRHGRWNDCGVRCACFLAEYQRVFYCMRCM